MWCLSASPYAGASSRPSLLPSIGQKKDPRYRWFVNNYGTRCWELDALDPNDLREIVQEAIEAEIEPDAWHRCAVIERAERESLREVLDNWRSAS